MSWSSFSSFVSRTPSIEFTSALPHRMKLSWSLAGTPSRSAITCTGTFLAKSSTRSNAPFSATRSRCRPTTASMAGICCRSARGVNQPPTYRRSRVWSGGLRIRNDRCKGFTSTRLSGAYAVSSTSAISDGAMTPQRGSRSTSAAIECSAVSSSPSLLGTSFPLARTDSYKG